MYTSIILLNLSEEQSSQQIMKSRLQILFVILLKLKNISTLGHCSESQLQELEQHYQNCSKRILTSKKFQSNGVEDPLCQIISFKVEKCTQKHAICMSKTDLGCERLRQLQRILHSLPDENTGKLSESLRKCSIYHKYHSTENGSCW